MSTLAQKVGDELNLLGAELDVHGRALVRIGQSGARVEGGIDELRELLLEALTRLERLEGGTIKAVSDLGARVYTLETHAGIPTPRGPEERPTVPPEQP